LLPRRCKLSPVLRRVSVRITPFEVLRDNQDERAATIRMRMCRG
jgi:hypothetical protein